MWGGFKLWGGGGRGGGEFAESVFAQIFLGIESRHSCNRGEGYEWVGMLNGSIMISNMVIYERVGMKNGSIMISNMVVYEKVGMKNGSIMISIMLCFYFLLISSISHINVTTSVR